MGEDRLNQRIPDVVNLADVEVTDLPDDITALVDSSRDYYTNAEKQRTVTLSTSHQANLSLISSRINWIDEQIAHLHSQREVLVSKQDHESKNVAILKSILSPIRRVPTDVLREIFQYCLPKALSGAPMSVSNADQAPLLLFQVCSKWRRTALGFPYLWRALSLKAKFKIKDERNYITTIHPSVSTILETWFSRAGTWCPLSLTLRLREVCEDFGEDSSELLLKFEELFNRLPNSRLQHLSFSVSSASNTYFLSKISRDFTELESIFLDAQSFRSSFYDPIPAPHHLLQSAPRLHSAELHNFIYDPFPKNLIPWSQLTHLRVERELGERLWHIIIRHCTNLQHGIFSLDMHGIRQPPGIPTSDHHISLPYLVDLTIHIDSQGCQPNFHRLVFPVLRRLQLLFGWIGLPHLWDNNFFSGTRTVSGSLTSLALVGSVIVTEVQIQLLLESSPSITELRVSVVTNYSNFFLALTDVRLLPKLETLRCDIRALEYAETNIPQLIASFVRSRWLISPPISTIARLRHLTLKFPSGWEYMDRVRQALEPFRNEGLSLVVDTVVADKSQDVKEMMTFEPQ